MQHSKEKGLKDEQKTPKHISYSYSITLY